MRMWMCDPRLLCRKHLLGEHGELHKHKWTFEKGHKKTKYIENNCIQPMAMKERHDKLAAEMIRRGYQHNSEFEMPDISYLPKNEKYYIIDKTAALKDLLGRCDVCKRGY